MRQYPVAPFIADFACRQARLLIELDGSQHAESRSDETRDRYLMQKGDRILRFWNAEVFNTLDGVCETILAAMDGRLEPYDRFKVG